MIDEEEIEEEESKEEAPKPKRKFNILGIVKKVVKYLLIISILSAGGYFGYRYYKGDENSYKHVQFTNAKSNESKLKFTFENLKNVYMGISEIDKEISKIDKEIERINSIESEYPNQKKITEKEKKYWNRLRKSLTKTLDKIESNIEIIFVTNSVNREKGKELLERNKDNLEKMVEDILKKSKEQTSQIKVKKEKSILEKMKSFF